MKTLQIEWLHLDLEGETCDRCQDTGQAIRKAVSQLQQECRPRGWNIVFKETKLPAGDIARSNLILIDGRPLESLLPDAVSSVNHCQSCCDLLGSLSVRCRTLLFAGKTYDSIPAHLIRKAVCTIAKCC